MRPMQFPPSTPLSATGETDMFHKFDLGGVMHELWLAPTVNGYYLRILDGWSGPVAFAEESTGRGSLTVAGTSEAVAFAVDGDVIHIHMRGRTRSLRYVDPLRALASVDGDDGHNVARAPMPGTVVALKVAPGDAVTAGTVLIVIESMKLETQIRASQDGIVERLHRQNKMFVRDRIQALLDPGTPFLELSTLAGNKAYDNEVPGAAQVVGIGIVSGREVIVHADDASVKGGAWYPLSVKKIVRALDVAIENRLPVVHLCDSAGGFLPLQAEFFADRYYAGRIFRNQSVLSKMGVPQVAVVMGHCTAGGAYVPALSDYNIIVRGTGAIFLAGPPLVKAATGEEVSVEELGGADMHTSVSGTGDYFASSEMHALAIARDIVARFNRIPKAAVDNVAPESPAYDPSELYGIIPKDPRVQFDMREIIARLVDGSRFHEYQPRYGQTLVCGFARLHGYQIGILANNGVLFSDSALKGAHFIQLCDKNRTPLLFLQNITGFMVGRDYERRGITKDGAKLIMAVAGAAVPKFT